MQRFINNLFAVRKGRFNETGSKFESVSISKIKFENSLNSINYEEQFYINYANSKEQKVYKIIQELYNEISNGNNNILRKYTFDEIYYKEKVVDRIISIINKSSNLEYSKSDLPYIYKLKNNIESKVHIYIIVNNSLAKILLIDLYHLSIPADIYSNGKLVKRVSLDDLKEMYVKLKNNKCNLNNIIKKDSILINC